MAYKIFIDANVLLDFTLKRAAYNESKQIVELAVKGKVEAFITPSIIHIVGYWLAKAYDASTAKKLFLTLLADIQVIDINQEVAMLALHSKINDIEDALQYYTAIHHKLDFFISSDKKQIKEGLAVLPVVSPKDFILDFGNS